MLNLMTQKKVNQTVPLTETVGSYTYTLTDNKKSLFNKNNVATIKTNKILTRSYY